MNQNLNLFVVSCNGINLLDVLNFCISNDITLNLIYIIDLIFNSLIKGLELLVALGLIVLSSRSFGKGVRTVADLTVIVGGGKLISDAFNSKDEDKRRNEEEKRRLEEEKRKIAEEKQRIAEERRKLREEAEKLAELKNKK